MPYTGPTYEEKTFHRKYEAEFGHLKPAMLPPTDYASKDQIIRLFPAYRREYLALENSGNVKKLVYSVEIDDFALQTPNKSHYLFKGTKLVIEPHKRCAVYGENGSGKTSLFVAIANGSVRDFPKYISTHHMKEMTHDPKAEGVSVFETVVSSHPMRRVLLVVQGILATQIAEEKDEARLANLKTNLAFVDLEFKKVEGDTTEKRASAFLRVLGFDATGEAAPMSSLSGGLRMRVALASAFIIDPDLLLLDEPTNHLDLPSVLWLENQLRGYKGSFLLVTHDRNLLENVVTSVYYLQDMEILALKMGFAEFEKQRAKMDDKRDKMIDKFMSLNRNLDPTSPLYRTKMEYAAWQKKRLERKVLLTGKFTFKAPEPLPCPAGMDPMNISLIKVEKVRFSYDEAKGLPFIFDTPISYDIKMSTRVGIMGPNGAGKSTFLKLITKNLAVTPGNGEIKINPDYVLAYFGQHSTKELKMEMTPIEFMIDSFPNANAGALKSHLEKTSVTSGPQQTRMENLSFSQRSCVIFAKLTFVPPHLLIMDEPTNFLDLDSVDSLINAANKFPGALIVVTHNRDFLKRCSKHFLSIVPGAFLEFETMKDAERATYSFISAMEEGRQVDHKQAIQDNRGGGAVHTEEEQAARQKALQKQQKAEAKKVAEAKAEEDAKAAEEAEKAKRLADKAATQKTDWVADEVCWAPTGNTYTEGKVVRNVPGMGVSVLLKTGKTVMIEAKKLKVTPPSGPAAAAAPKAATNKGPADAKGAAKGPAGKGPAAAATQKGKAVATPGKRAGGA